MNHHLRHAKTFARLMDSQFSVFGIRFGLENIIGFVPGLGDVISLALSSYLLWIAYQLKLPTRVLVQMVVNIGLDAVIGMVPILGDLGDIFFKANLRNLRILEENVVQEGKIILE